MFELNQFDNHLDKRSILPDFRFSSPARETVPSFFLPKINKVYFAF
jgi:hypothetical protein